MFFGFELARCRQASCVVSFAAKTLFFCEKKWRKITIFLQINRDEKVVFYVFCRSRGKRPIAIADSRSARRSLRSIQKCVFFAQFRDTLAQLNYIISFFGFFSSENAHFGHIFVSFVKNYQITYFFIFNKKY